MKIASFALASALTVVVGCAQPVLAHTQDQTGATVDHSGSSMTGQTTDQAPAVNGSGDAVTTGANAGGDNSAMDNDEDNDRTAGRDDDGPNRWSRGDDGAMGRMGMMRRHRMMMMGAMGGAQFHFARGNSRIDVRCPVDEDVRQYGPPRVRGQRGQDGPALRRSDLRDPAPYDQLHGAQQP